MRKRTLVFFSEPGRLSRVRAVMRNFLARCKFEECAAEAMVLAVDEACTNIIRHAYDYARKPVRLEMERLADRVRFTLRDYGKPCEPSKIKGRRLAEVRPGGVGVHIIRKVFDEVSYQPMARGTKLQLIKKLQESTRPRARA